MNSLLYLVSVFIAGALGRWPEVHVREIVILDGENNECLRANLTMKIEVTPATGSRHAPKINIPVETSNYTGICEGEGVLAGQAVVGPAVAFEWAVPGGAEDSVLILWREDDDTVFIDRIDVDVTLTEAAGQSRISQRTSGLQLFPSSLGSVTNLRFSQVRIADCVEFVFCGGDYFIRSSGSDTFFLVGVFSGIAVMMLLGGGIYINGTRRRRKQQPAV